MKLLLCGFDSIFGIELEFGYIVWMIVFWVDVDLNLGEFVRVWIIIFYGSVSFLDSGYFDCMIFLGLECCDWCVVNEFILVYVRKVIEFLCLVFFRLVILKWILYYWSIFGFWLWVFLWYLVLVGEMVCWCLECLFGMVI